MNSISEKRKLQAGFSVAESLVVLAITAVMASVSLYYLYSHEKLYRPDEQAAHVVDLLQEARQRALTQKVTMRVEIDRTSKVARLINEGDALVATDDKILREIVLDPEQEVRFEKRPLNVTTSPTESAPVPAAVFVTSSIHPLSLGKNVATFRFRKDGTVANAGTTAVGGGSIITGATIFFWQPKVENTEHATITRAVTIIGSSGAIRLWNYYPSAPTASQWRDSRRFQ
jgi:Tfp pilus assembly protein FimT